MDATALSAMSFPDGPAVLSLAKPLIEKFEGFSPRPYLCPAGHWTVGWGATRYPNGKPVMRDDYPGGIPEDFAANCLVAAMLRVSESLGFCVTRRPTLHQAAALISLGFNVGVGAHDGIKGDLADSALLSKFNAGDFAGAADQFLIWNKAHVAGVLSVLPGLTRRREAERKMFLTPDEA
jgi:GH24 family phage-related lysozyme (muramidase)